LRRVDNIEQVRARIVFAIAPDQGLVVVAEIEPQPGPCAIIVMAFAETGFGKQRGQHVAARGESIFGAERRRVTAAEIALADRRLPVVGNVIFERHRVEKARHVLEDAVWRRGGDEAAGNSDDRDGIVGGIVAELGPRHAA
jgi:hypothetical protein